MSFVYPTTTDVLEYTKPFTKKRTFIPTTTTERAEEEEFGWRYSTRVLPDGTEISEYRPLTILDVLFPEEGDEVSVRNRHTISQTYSYNAMRASSQHKPSMVVLKEMRIDLGLPGLRPVAPDAALVSGIKRPKNYNWSTFYVKDEGAKVEVVLEITSPGTRCLDMDPSLLTEKELRLFEYKKREHPGLRSKWEIYAEAGIAVYIVLDLPDDDAPEGTLPKLYVYCLNRLGFYDLCQPDTHGRVWIEAAKMYVGLGKDDICWFHEQGHKVVDYTEMVQARRIAEERAEYVVQRLDEADERAREADERAREAEELARLERERTREAEELARLERERTRETQRNTVRNLQAKGFEPSLIADITGLSLADISALAEG